MDYGNIKILQQRMCEVKIDSKRNVHNVMFQLQIIYYRLISKQPRGPIYMQQCMIGH